MQSPNRYLFHTKDIMYFGITVPAQAGNCRNVADYSPIYIAVDKL